MEKIGFAALSYALNLYFYVVAVLLLAGFITLLLPGIFIVYLVLDTLGNQVVSNNKKSDGHLIISHYTPLFQALQVVTAQWNTMTLLTFGAQTLGIMYVIISLLLLTKFASTSGEILVCIVTALFNITVVYLGNLHPGRIFKLSNNILMTWKKQMRRDKLSKLTLASLHPIKLNCGSTHHFDGGSVVEAAQIVIENYISVLLAIK
ncbi:unnamed protein product [Allacma fusca]|uniref:Uncharacterized protein n=1 Tax=Allacma fusca TaxID=39272 RepID=A0A8J2K3W4_9HEXA|nr:unnamed protein product [Allacma fusca]